MENLPEKLRELLKTSLQGGNYDPESLDHLQPDALLEDLGIDSLDMTDFFLRVQDACNCRIKREDFSRLISLSAIQAYLEQSTDPAQKE